jgi:uncharacterized membrane protein
MATNAVRARDKDTLAQFLGWFSVGLGAAQVTAPRLMSRLVGASPDGWAPRVMRLMGAREITQGVGILSRPRPTAWVWSRVAGDALDLALLGLVAARGPGRFRAAFAFANTLPIAVADVMESRYLAEQDGEPRSGRLIRKAVTINRSREEVERAWAEADELRREVEEAGASVRFAEAPGGRGTELIVEFVYDPPLGDLGAAAEKLTGRDLATRLADGLRRFKQRVETGRVVRSDATPDGHSLADHLRQRAAQPLERKEAVS